VTLAGFGEDEAYWIHRFCPLRLNLHQGNLWNLRSLCRCPCFEEARAPALTSARIQRRCEPQTSKGPPEHKNPRRTTAGTNAAPPERSRGESNGNHPAATVQKPQGAAATSPQGPLAAIYTRADTAMDPETRDPGTYHSPSRGPGKQPPGVRKHTQSTQPWIPRAKSTPAGRDPNHRQGISFKLSRGSPPPT
ncbi:hypothetical protein CRENBAI_005411, partial [Crenichthys baileyi]